MKISGLIFLSLSFLLPPLANAQSAPDSGVLITRLNSQQWQIRLVAGTASQQFSGVVESDLPITAVRGARPGSTGSAKLLTSTSLGATLSAPPGGADGVTFSASTDAKLCLRDAGSSGVHIYFGESLADAVPVTAPVALSSLDACGDAVAAVAAASIRKYHPGHYTIVVNGGKYLPTAIQPGMVGIVRRYSWRLLETSQGVYNFSAIKHDLAWASANGMRLVAMIVYKSFGGGKAGPGYLDAYDLHNRTGGSTMELWAPQVVTRYNALIKALGAQVDSNPNFEGIATQETALSLDSATLKAHGYTPEKYRDALINMLSASAASLPASRVFWYMNFLVGKQSYLGSVAAAVAPKGVAMGGPDDWPDNKSLATQTYPFYTQFAGKMPLFIQVEASNYALPHLTNCCATPYWTMPELYKYAVTNLHVNYMFWMRTTRPANSRSYDWYDALPVIAAHPKFN